MMEYYQLQIEYRIYVCHTSGQIKQKIATPLTTGCQYSMDLLNRRQQVFNIYDVTVTFVNIETF